MSQEKSAWPKEGTPFHEGELLLQSRAGSSAFADRAGRAMIRDYMPLQHRELFEKLPYLIVGSLDPRGYPWASFLYKAQGLITSPDPQTLCVRAWPSPLDPLRERLFGGAPIALLGIELHTRRRNRMNGFVKEANEEGFSVRVGQSFGNCPQYIQARAPLSLQEAASPTLQPEGPRLSERASSIVLRADTFFIATASPKAGGDDPREGVDVSHRGGKPGFIRHIVEENSSVLEIPDFSGNSLFNTFGNLVKNPKAGLLWIDFETGDLLQLTGEALVVWESPKIAAFEGAERLLRFRVFGGRLITQGAPLLWSPPVQASQLARTGSWEKKSQP